MKLAVDAMGGDNAPVEIIKGAILAAEKFSGEIILVGDENKIREVLKNERAPDNLNISIRHAGEVVEMGEHPADAVRTISSSAIPSNGLPGRSLFRLST